jgi:calcium-dependent protein kinase
LIDFGLSKIVNEEEEIPKECNKIIGTSYYVAPEALTGQYSVAGDMWSLGIVIYILVTGHPPFIGESSYQIFQQIITQEPDFTSKR